MKNKLIEKLREDMADQAHKSWSGWMNYIFSGGTMNSDGSFTITPESVGRWITQMNLPYQMLSEQEKDSDRIEAEKYLEILFQSGICLEKHADDYVRIKGFWRKEDDK